MKLNFPLLERHFQCVSALDALEILCNIFAANNAHVEIKGTLFALIDLYDFSTEYFSLMAKDIQLAFYGGPPPGKWWFESNLYTMLLDHILYSMLVGDKKKVLLALKSVGALA